MRHTENNESDTEHSTHVTYPGLEDNLSQFSRLDFSLLAQLMISTYYPSHPIPDIFPPLTTEVLQDYTQISLYTYHLVLLSQYE